jgi:AraC-like DNA-binding protein
MTHWKQPEMHGGINLFGIKFKPAAFAVFYNYTSLRDMTDRTVDFEKKLSPEVGKIRKGGVKYLDRFFMEKLSVPKHQLFPVIEDIQQYHGGLPVEMIAKRHFITERQLERKFNQYLGVGPREFSSFVRYQFAVENIKKNTRGKSLHDIARECGYYDHAHLTHQVKKYSGLLPSEL